jgi:hypothetical protein
MLVNRDQTRAHAVTIDFEDAGNPSRQGFSGPVRVVSFGAEQYTWIEDGPNSHADPDNPPLGATVVANSATTFTLPKASVTVLRGNLASSP